MVSSILTCYFINTFLEFQDKEFIYRGNECEKLIPFQDRFQQEFSGASVLDHMNLPSDGIRQGPGRCILSPSTRFYLHTYSLAFVLLCRERHRTE